VTFNVDILLQQYIRLCNQADLAPTASDDDNELAGLGLRQVILDYDGTRSAPPEDPWRSRVVGICASAIQIEGVSSVARTRARQA